MTAAVIRDRVDGVPVLHLAAFPTAAGGGNPAGVVLGADPRELDEPRMQAVARDGGYSETAFLTDGPVDPHRRQYHVRYFSPGAEVPFCGHATIALAVAVAERIGAGPLAFHTEAGRIAVTTTRDEAGRVTATLTSAAPRHFPVDADVLDEALSCFGWTRADLDRRVTPAVAFAGARHLILALSDRARLAQMSYDFERLQALSTTRGWVTVHVAVMETPELHHVRAPFPFGGVVEDPATGAGAAAYGAYLRDTNVLAAPFELTVSQGQDMGQPCRLTVHVPAAGPADVSGTATPLSR